MTSLPLHLKCTMKLASDSLRMWSPKIQNIVDIFWITLSNWWHSFYIPPLTSAIQFLFSVAYFIKTLLSPFQSTSTTSAWNVVDKTGKQFERGHKKINNHPVLWEIPFRKDTDIDYPSILFRRHLSLLHSKWDWDYSIGRINKRWIKKAGRKIGGIIK